jgi:XTP/dITP diphosphohydrolase
MQKLLVATTNKGKIIEISEFLKDFPVNLVSLKDVGINDDVEENGITYEENSRAKAIFYAKKSNLPAIADDGGLEISALGGAPGLKSRRWLGYHGTDEELLAHLQKVANELPEKNRIAKFVAVLTFALPTGKWWSEKGEVVGEIAKNPHPKLLKGYPYRSFFYLPNIAKYYHESELTSKETKEYNHRWKAINKLKPIITKELDL